MKHAIQTPRQPAEVCPGGGGDSPENQGAGAEPQAAAVGAEGAPRAPR